MGNIDYHALSLKLKKDFSELARWQKSLILVREQLSPHEKNAVMLLSVDKPIDLAKLLNRSFFQLENHINMPAYNRFSLFKKNGRIREIIAPQYELNSLQKRLNKFLQAFYLCIKPDQVHGFVPSPRYLGKSCNIVENAKVHVGKKNILNIDLLDFFPSIGAGRVRDTFISDTFRFNEQIATAIALLVTYKGRLPVGAPTSPVISNFVCLDLDNNLQALASYKGYTYTRYADDITFSSNHGFGEYDLDDIEVTIENNQFRINHDKTRMTGSNRKQMVTGIVVNKKINIDRRLLKKIRAMVYDLSRNGLEQAVQNHFKIHAKGDQVTNSRFIELLRGYLSFICQVRGSKDPLYQRLKNDFNKAVRIPKQVGLLK